jgi:hypothetical protein
MKTARGESGLCAMQRSACLWPAEQCDRRRKGATSCWDRPRRPPRASESGTQPGAEGDGGALELLRGDRSGQEDPVGLPAAQADEKAPHVGSHHRRVARAAHLASGDRLPGGRDGGHGLLLAARAECAGGSGDGMTLADPQGIKAIPRRQSGVRGRGVGRRLIAPWPDRAELRPGSGATRVARADSVCPWSKTGRGRSTGWRRYWRAPTSS